MAERAPKSLFVGELNEYGVPFLTSAQAKIPLNIRERFLPYRELCVGYFPESDSYLRNELRYIEVPDRPPASFCYVMRGRFSIPEALIFHYTTFDAFTSIVEHSEIWASHFTGMNDSREIIDSIDYLWFIINQISAGKYSREDYDIVRAALLDDLNIYIASFSKHPNQLSQWRAYAPVRGMSIGFPRSLFEARDDSSANFLFRDVVYDRQTKFEQLLPVAETISSILGDITDNQDRYSEIHKLQNIFSNIASFHKHRAFSEEGEVRLVSHGAMFDIHERKGRYGSVKYIRVSLSHLFRAHEELDFIFTYIINGPAIDPYGAVKDTNCVLSRNKTKYLTVFECGIPFRVF